MLYFDNAATTPVTEASLTAAWPYLTTEFGNASSSHEYGHRAKQGLEDARARVATWFGAKSSDIIFTSGGTEGINMCLTGLALANPRGKHIISARTEHEAVIATLEFLERVHGFEITWLPTNTSGTIEPLELESALRDDTTLVTLMLANNEIGTIHPIAEFAALAHARGALIHTDAVQACGWVNSNVADLGVDALTIAGHKLGAPKGSGAVFIKGRVATEPILHGGGQEFDRRSGTENVAWAVALATALEHLPRGEQLVQQSQKLADLQKVFIERVTNELPHTRLTGPPAGDPLARHAGISSFVSEGINGETLLLELERRGVIASSGAACAAGQDEPSHVLIALGYPEDLARTAIRLSASHLATEADYETVATAFIESVHTITR